jgi:hypothetical protein
MSGKGKEPSPARLSIDLTPEQQVKLWKHLEWGEKGRFFRVIIDDIIEMLEEHGEIFKAAVFSRKISMLDYLSDKGKEDGND